MKQRNLMPVVLAVALLCASLPGVADEPTQQQQENVRKLLKEIRTKAAMDLFAGSPSKSCVDLPPDSRICSWRLNNSRENWEQMARALDTKYRVALVCEFLTDGERNEDSCRAYPAHYEASSLPRVKESGGESSWDAGPIFRSNKKEVTADAVSRLSNARTLWQLIELVGFGPSMCTDESATHRRCVWRVRYHDIGYSVVAISGHIRVGNKIRLVCILPRHGQERSDDSCHVEIDG